MAAVMPPGVARGRARAKPGEGVSRRAGAWPAGCASIKAERAAFELVPGARDLGVIFCVATAYPTCRPCLA